MAELLPPLLNAKLSRLRRRIIVSGAISFCSMLGSVLAGLFLIFLLWDRVVGFSVFGLRLAATCWLAVVGFAAIVSVALVIRRRNSTRDLAERVERRFPELQERLLSLVSLPRETLPSPIVNDLIAETTQIGTPLDFFQAFSTQRTRYWSRIVMGLLLLAIAPTIVWPEATRFAQRFFHAWSPAVHGFEIATRPSAPFAALGRPLILEAELLQTDLAARLPDRCLALVQEDGKPARSVPMEPTLPGRFAIVIPAMPTSLTFHVQAGELISEARHLEGLAPVSLTQGPDLHITPPSYVNSREMPENAVADGVAFRALQYSELQYTFHLDRPAHRVMLTWTTAVAKEDRILAVAADGRKLRARIVADQLGACSGVLTLETAEGIVTTVPLVSGQVWADPPPLFSGPVRVGGTNPTSTRPKIGPDEILRIQATLDDAVGLDRLELDLRVNEKSRPTQVLETLAGERRVSREWAVSLRGQVKPGDRVDLRLRGIDNRRLKAGQVRDYPALPGQDLEPQIVVDPPAEKDREGWFSFDVEAQAEPLEKQNILAENEDLTRQLKLIRKGLEAEKAVLDKTIRASHGSPVWTPDQARGLAEAKSLNGRHQEMLRVLATQAQALRGMEPLARLSRDVAARELASAERAIVKAETPGQTREPALKQAEQEVQAALKRLDHLQKANDLLAQDRLQQWELEHLAMKEDDLAKQVTQLPKDDPQALAQELAKLKKQQEDIAAKLEAWAQNQPLLKNLAALLQKQRADSLAEKAKMFAQEERALAAGRAKALDEKLKEALADVALRQSVLADKVSRLARDLHVGLDRRELAVPTPAAKKAAEHLMEGRVEPALADQGKTIEGLVAVEKNLEQTPVQGGDPRRNAARLAELQAKLIDDLEKFGQEFPRLTTEQTLARIADLQQRQKAIHVAIGKLSIPANLKEAGKLRASANESAEESVRLMARKDFLPARDAMEKTRDTLRQLAAALPDAPQTDAKEQEAFADKARQAGMTSAQALAKEQKEIQDAVLKALADAMKSGPGAGGGPEPLAKSLEQLKNDVMKLSQSMENPEAKALAKESAQALDDAAQAMKKAQDDRDQGQMTMANKSEKDAATKLEFAGQKVAESGDKASMGQPKPSEEEARLAQSFQESQANVAKAQKTPQQPSAQALQKAAQSLRQTAKLSGDPNRSRFAQPGPQGLSPDLTSATKFLADPLSPQAWGDLPGEVRTRLVQDLRARYGDDYEAIIQRYFRNLAKSPTRQP